MRFITRIHILLIVFGLAINQNFAQNAPDVFGKNRIQYQNFQWSVVSTDNFDIYYYPQSKSAAILAAGYAETEFERLSDILGYSPYVRIKLIIYATHSDLIQSNIGLANPTVLIGGYNVFLKNRVEVAFNSVQTDFKKDITKGIASMLLNDMMYGGGSVKDVLLNTYFMSLPEWFLSGLVEYLAEGWNTETDDKIRDLFSSYKFRKPTRFSGEDAKTVGLSVWNYIGERYGKASVASILSNTRLSKNHEESIMNVSRTKYKVFLKDWRTYYRAMTQDANSKFIIPDDSLKNIKYTKHEVHYGSIKMSPDGTRFAYVQNNKGRYKVYVKNVETGKKYVVYRGGYKSYEQKVNYDLPVLAWRNNDKIGVINVKADKLRLITYDIKKEIKDRKERIRLEISNFLNFRYTKKQTYRGLYQHVRQVNEFNFSEDGASLIMSGENKLGQSDIYYYNLRNNNVTALTNDIYDDRFPSFLPKSNKAFVFNSNRLTDSLQPKAKVEYRNLVNKHNIFYANTDSSKVMAKRISDTKNNEIQPKITTDGTIYYLSDKNGIYELFKKEPNQIPQTLTNYRQSILSYDLRVKDSVLAFVSKIKGKPRLLLDTNFIFSNVIENPAKTERQNLEDNTVFDYSSYKDITPKVLEKKPIITRFELEQNRKKPIVTDTTEIDTENYVFEFEKNPKKPTLTTNTLIETDTSKIPVLKKKKVIQIQFKNNEIYISSPLRYKRDFGMDNTTSSIRIDPLRGTGAIFGANMSDIMANHRFHAQLFFTFDFNNSIFVGDYEYLKNRIDYKFRFTRDTYRSPANNANNFGHSYYLYKTEFSSSYPINPMTKLSLTPIFMNTRNANLDYNKIAIPDLTRNYLGLNFEFTFDNNRQKGTNLNEGTKAKFGFSNYMSIGNSDQNFGKIYIDVRRYLKIHRELTFATRGSAGSFIGASPKNFVLGGMDNWLFNSKNNDASTPLNPDLNDTKDNTDILFTEYITTMRGFPYAQFFGNNFLLWNSELRLPVFRYLIRGNIKSNFIRNFQLATFYDVGTAWSGGNPFSLENTNNTKNVTSGTSNISATVVTYSNKFLQGYGFGVRSMMMGYYTKINLAWGVQDFVRQSPRLHISLGYDF